MRERYNGTILNQSYNGSDIYIISSDYARTIKGAELILAGMYPPQCNDIRNPHLDWQPIPVHSIPRKFDTLIDPAKPCPRYDYLYSELLKTKAFQLIQSNNQWLYNYLSEKSGECIDDIISAAELYNILLTEGIFLNLEYVLSIMYFIEM